MRITDGFSLLIVLLSSASISSSLFTNCFDYKDSKSCSEECSWDKELSKCLYFDNGTSSEYYDIYVEADSKWYEETQDYYSDGDLYPTFLAFPFPLFGEILRNWILVVQDMKVKFTDSSFYAKLFGSEGLQSTGKKMTKDVAFEFLALRWTDVIYKGGKWSNEIVLHADGNIFLNYRKLSNSTTFPDVKVGSYLDPNDEILNLDLSKYASLDSVSIRLVYKGFCAFQSSENECEKALKCQWCEPLRKCGNAGFLSRFENEEWSNNCLNDNYLSPRKEEPSEPIPTARYKPTQYYDVTYAVWNASATADVWTPVLAIDEIHIDPHTHLDIELNFPFPFYGHDVRMISIFRNGWILLPTSKNSFENPIQYIAPFKVRDDPTLNGKLRTFFKSESHYVVFQWTNLPFGSEFATFQLTLYENGNILFSYKDVPSSADSELVSIGMSDGFEIHNSTSVIGYHQINLKTTKTVSQSAIRLLALPTCQKFKTCWECATGAKALSYDCMWCPGISSCSNGYDRSRGAWDKEMCFAEHRSIKNIDECPIERVSTRYLYYQQEIISDRSETYDVFKTSITDLDFKKIQIDRNLWIDSKSSKIPIEIFQRNVYTMYLSKEGYMAVQDEKNSLPFAIVAPLRTTSHFKMFDVAYNATDKEFVVKWWNPDFAFYSTFHRDFHNISFFYERVGKIPDEGEYFCGVVYKELHMEKKAIIETKIDTNPMHIHPGLSIRYSPLKKCEMFKTCSTCLKSAYDLFCSWNGEACLLDHFNLHSRKNTCEEDTTTTTTTTPFYPSIDPKIEDNEIKDASAIPVKSEDKDSGSGVPIGGIITAIFFIILAAVLMGVLWYGYLNPASPVGQHLVRLRTKINSWNVLP